jgi:hypothetical protein
MTMTTLIGLLSGKFMSISTAVAEAMKLIGDKPPPSTPADPVALEPVHKTGSGGLPASWGSQEGVQVEVEHLDNLVARSTPQFVVSESELIMEIESIARYHRIYPDTVVKIAKVESNLLPGAISHSKAVGLMQLTTIAIQEAKRVGGAFYYDPPGNDKFNVRWNVTVGCILIKRLGRMLGLSLALPLSDRELSRLYGAYNLGPGAFSDWANEDYSSPRLVSSYSNQGSHLKSGGIERYLDNVEKMFQNVS